ncbi:unnamed protein product [Bursaphelenchus okinawaensis]|uniref:Uncharacterized protein n=1 Tax=Bursaphelenchus okinawaensis TaxID=465554 RepID=A0A811KYZ4_9BILA|nr:unnamed protein product [Bursaphelenchus okinawaensis]CAG9114555.1 unnamed protein product [Bursaphelenchus okinawaensis]
MFSRLLRCQPANLQILRFKVRKTGKKPAVKASKAAIPLAAEQKLKSWPKLVELEKQAVINASSANANFRDLTLRDFKYDVFDGRVIELNFPVNVSDAELARIYATLKPGAWVQVIAGNDRFLMVVLNLGVDSIRLKFKGNVLFDLNNYSDVSFTISTERESGPIDYLAHIWLDKKKIAKMPGWSNFLMAHHGKALPMLGKTKNVKFFARTLNKSQQEAVTKALNPRQTILSIQGPPGTGKTAVVAEIVQQVAKSGKKILVLAPSRKAINNVSSRVHQQIRNSQGHFNVTHGEAALSINDRIKSHDDFHRLEAFLPSPSDLWSSEDKTSMNKYNHAMMLKNDLKTEILTDAKVVYSTIQSSTVRQLDSFKFQPDYLVIDEAAQTWECVAWHAALLAPKVIFVGDQYQLTSTCVSAEAAEQGLNKTVMEYIEKEFGHNLQTRLKKQYRSNAKIMRWSSETFYEGEIEADESVAEITVDDLITNDKVTVDRDPILFFDTCKRGDAYKERRSDGNSYFNQGEAFLILEHVKKLVEAGVKQTDIGIITPYAGQVRYIRSLMVNNNLKDVIVSTVDGFQGGEHEVICLSFVRSNRKRIIGFLNDLRRMNVSLTRAKRQLVIVADSRMLQEEKALKRLHEILEEEAKVIIVGNQRNWKVA